MCGGLRVPNTGESFQNDENGVWGIFQNAWKNIHPCFKIIFNLTNLNSERIIMSSSSVDNNCFIKGDADARTSLENLILPSEQTKHPSKF